MAKDRQISITSVEFDARKVTPGSLFVPLVGGATDGHSYIQQALDNGAVATHFVFSDGARLAFEQDGNAVAHRVGQAGGAGDEFVLAAHVVQRTFGDVMTRLKRMKQLQKGKQS